MFPSCDFYPFLEDLRCVEVMKLCFQTASCLSSLEDLRCLEAVKFCFQTAGCLLSLEDLRRLEAVKFELHARWAPNCRTLGSSPSSRSYLPGRPRSFADDGPGGPPIPARLSGNVSVFPSQSEFSCLVFLACRVVQWQRPLPSPCTAVLAPALRVA